MSETHVIRSPLGAFLSVSRADLDELGDPKVGEVVELQLDADTTETRFELGQRVFATESEDGNAMRIRWQGEHFTPSADELEGVTVEWPYTPMHT